MSGLTDSDLTAAQANTEKEILASALDDEEPGDETDRSLEDMGDGLEGQTDDAPGDGDGDGEADEDTGEGDEETGEAEDEDEGETPKPEAKAPQVDTSDLRGLPPGARAAIVAERKARQAAEAALETERVNARKEIDAINARLDRALAGLERGSAPKAPEPAAPAKPDPVLDPEGYERYLETQFENRAMMRRVEETFADAHEAHGKDFEAAQAALDRLDNRNPVDRALVQRIARSPNPGKALMRWHKEQTALREIGGDPAAYRQRVRDELLNDPDVVKAVLDRQRDRGREGGSNAPRNVTRLPPSLNRARGGSSGKERLTAADNTDSAVLDYALSD